MNAFLFSKMAKRPRSFVTLRTRKCSLMFPLPLFKNNLLYMIRHIVYYVKKKKNEWILYPDGQAPEVVRDLEDTEVIAPKDVALSCTITPGDPVAELHWYLNNKEIYKDKRHSLSYKYVMVLYSLKRFRIFEFSRFRKLSGLDECTNDTKKVPLIWYFVWERGFRNFRVYIFREILGLEESLITLAWTFMLHFRESLKTNLVISVFLFSEKGKLIIFLTLFF